MSKYIDRSKVNDEIVRVLEHTDCKGEYIDRVLRAIENLPSIDIVQCKDCKHRYVTGVTTQYYVCDFMGAEYSDDGYCHRGERIEK